MKVPLVIHVGLDYIDLLCQLLPMEIEVKAMSAAKSESEKEVDLFNRFEQLICRLPRNSGLKNAFRDLIHEFQRVLREIAGHKAAGLFMCASAPKFEAVFNAVYDGLIVSSVEEKDQAWGNILEANAAALKLLEYDMAEMRTISFPAVLAAGFDPSQVEVKLLNGKEAIYEADIVSKSGKVILCELRSKPFLQDAKRYIVTVLRDIREQRALEKKLTEQSYALRTAQSIAGLSNWHFDLVTGEGAYSDLVQKITGLDEKNGETLSLSTFLNALHPQDREKIRNIHRHVDANKEFALDLRIMRPLGGLSYIHSTGRIFFDHAGTPVKIVGVSQDVTEKRLAEENIRHSEQNLRSILEAISVGQWEYDSVARRFATSESLSLFYGYSRTRTTFTENEVFESIHVEDRARVRNDFYKLLSFRRNSLNSSFRAKRRDGEFVWVLYRAVLIRALPGAAVRVVGCVEDLRESMQFDKMKEQLEFLERMISIIPVPIFYKDLNGRYIGHNAAYKKFVEQHIGTLIGKTVFDVFKEKNNPKTAQVLDQMDKDLILNGGSQSRTIKFISSSKEERILVDHKSILVGYDKKPQYIVGAVFDITDIKKAEIALRKTTQQLNMTFNAMHEIIMCFDFNLTLQWANRAAKNTFAARGKKIIGSKWQEIWFGDAPGYEEAFHIKYAFSGNGGTDKRIITTANGKVYEVWRYPAKVRHGKILLVVEAAIDVTDRVAAENKAKLHHQQLIQADKMTSLGILVAGVAHEISNPNNFITINISILNKIWRDFMPLLNREISENKRQAFGGIPAAKVEYSVKTLFAGIKEGAERIMKIVDTLKGYVKETTPEQIEQFSVNDAIARSIFLLNNLLKKSTKHFRLNCDATIPQVNGVPQRIEQVIINVLQNACIALTSHHQAIEVSTCFVSATQEVVIEVKDEGRGIEEESLQHITDPFFTTRRESGGTGLGLSISNSIMEEHRGRLEFKSRKGSGTSVKIVLPAAPPNGA